MARILVIEDNVTNLKLATLLLTRAGHTVLSAADAETGLMLAHSDGPELILMDIQLPGMDGLAATVLLKQGPTTRDIPVIALTAMAMKIDQERSRLAGCDGYITKPLRYPELYAAIDALLARRAVASTGGFVAPERPRLFGGDRVDAALPMSDRAAPPVDVSRLESLVGSDPAVVLDFLTDFRTSAVETCARLLHSCRAADAADVSALAHTLTSSSHAVGAARLAGLCQRLEAAGRAGDLESLSSLGPAFEAEFTAVLSWLDAHLAAGPPVAS